MACSFHQIPAFYIQCSSKRGDQESNKQKLNCVKINGTKSFSSANVDLLRHDHGYAITSVENMQLFEQESRQNIPSTKQLVDPYRQGMIIEEGVGYRQTVVIRSYEVGPDKTTTIESILSLLQVTNEAEFYVNQFLAHIFKQY